MNKPPKDDQVDKKELQDIAREVFQKNKTKNSPKTASTKTIVGYSLDRLSVSVSGLSGSECVLSVDGLMARTFDAGRCREMQDDEGISWFVFDIFSHFCCIFGCFWLILLFFRNFLPLLAIFDHPPLLVIFGPF